VLGCWGCVRVREGVYAGIALDAIAWVSTAMLQDMGGCSGHSEGNKQECRIEGRGGVRIVLRLRFAYRSTGYRVRVGSG